jgi:hypothetical protein
MQLCKVGYAHHILNVFAKILFDQPAPSTAWTIRYLCAVISNLQGISSGPHAKPFICNYSGSRFKSDEDLNDER